jgi:hypothetical protein
MQCNDGKKYRKVMWCYIISILEHDYIMSKNNWAPFPLIILCQIIVYIVYEFYEKITNKIFKRKLHLWTDTLSV